MQHYLLIFYSLFFSTGFMGGAALFILGLRVRSRLIRPLCLAKIAQAIVYDTVGAPYSSSFKSDYAVLTIPTFAIRSLNPYKVFLQDFFNELSAR